jgi:hypothetical protein
MDELFGNLIYLLPIALIVVRVISAAGNSKKKKPPSAPGETPRRAPEQERIPGQDMDPGMREFLKQFGVSPPPARPAPVKKRPVKEKPKKAPEKAPPLFAETLNGEVPKQEGQTGNPGQAVQAESRGVPKLPVGLSPLQQGFLWAEILGPAKAMQD